MEDGIAFETKMGDGSAPDSGFMGKLMAVGKRALTGESIFMTHFTNRGAGKKHVAFAAPYPGTVVPIDLSTLGGEGLFLATLQGHGTVWLQRCWLHHPDSTSPRPSSTRAVTC